MSLVQTINDGALCQECCIALGLEDDDIIGLVLGDGGCENCGDEGEQVSMDDDGELWVRHD